MLQGHKRTQLYIVAAAMYYVQRKMWCTGAKNGYPGTKHLPLKYVQIFSLEIFKCMCICDIPWYRDFPRNPFIINISMYFGATEKWYVQMVMVSRVVQLAGASDAPPGTRVSNRTVCGVILVIADV